MDYMALQMLVDVFDEAIDFNDTHKILAKFNPLILKCAKSYSVTCRITPEDMRQEIRVIILESLPRYIHEKNVKLSTFVINNLFNKLNSLIQKSNAKKRDAVIFFENKKIAREPILFSSIGNIVSDDDAPAIFWDPPADLSLFECVKNVYDKIIFKIDFMKFIDGIHKNIHKQAKTALLDLYLYDENLTRSRKRKKKAIKIKKKFRKKHEKEPVKKLTRAGLDYHIHYIIAPKLQYLKVYTSNYLETTYPVNKHLK